MTATRARAAARAHDAMMTAATVIYNAIPWALGKQDLERQRVELAEALVGEFHCAAGRARP